MENRMLENLELGPIRPPSEAESLLLRVTRNCPWNQCKFCGLYKGKKFSLRDKEEIKAEIRRVKHYADTGEFDGSSAAQMAHQWKLAGMKSVFLQDANTLIAPSEDLAEIIRLVKEEFPSVERVTSYARSHTVARKTEEELNTLFAAGLNRVHIGMESGCDAVLEGVKKGATKAIHIEAGRKIKAAGITLSEYYMPGLGGKEYSEKNAEETADALNQIDPDYIRIRTFVVIDGVPLAEDYANG
ncbi:MAG: radical SAM protein, partial [Anaerovoracaceae bacterium]